MRPEYIEAVDAARWGWTFWAILVVPAILIWGAMLFNLLPHKRNSFAIGCASFALACFLFFMLTAVHASVIEAAKEHNMVTPEEERDWAADETFPLVAAPFAIAYCVANVFVATIVDYLIRLVFLPEPTAKEISSPKPTASSNNDNPYRSPES